MSNERTGRRPSIPAKDIESKLICLEMLLGSALSAAESEGSEVSISIEASKHIIRDLRIDMFGEDE